MPTETQWRHSRLGVLLMKASVNLKIDGVCLARTAKAVHLLLKTGKKGWIPLSHIKAVVGELSPSQSVTLTVPDWIITRITNPEVTNPLSTDIPPKASVLITGTRVDASEKALQIHCDADGISRWLALSQIRLEGEIPTHQAPVRLTAPAWLLRHKSGHYPSWVKGALV